MDSVLAYVKMRFFMGKRCFFLVIVSRMFFGMPKGLEQVQSIADSMECRGSLFHRMCISE